MPLFLDRDRDWQMDEGKSITETGDTRRYRWIKRSIPGLAYVKEAMSCKGSKKEEGE